MENKINIREIENIREEIDKIDESLISFLDKRMNLAVAIGDIKRKNNLPIFNRKREEEILEKTNKAKNNPFIKNIFKKILEESRNLQKNNFVKIATLGPSGTCSENTVKSFIAERGLNGEILLKETFQDCVASLISKEVDFIIVPSAFKELNELIFKNLGKIKIKECFVLNTPALVIGVKEKNKIMSIATHSAPEILAKNNFPDIKIIGSPSNSKSAIMVVEGKADACLTTEIAAKANNLKILKNFGEVPMSWNVFGRVE